MTKVNSSIILKKAVKVFAQNGMDNFSIRKLAREIPISPSVIYHYFEDENTLLKTMFDNVTSDLGNKRAFLKRPKNAKEMLKQRIAFQIENQESIIAVLKYYLAFRNIFKKAGNGFVPDKSYLHIEEVLKLGIKTREFKVNNLKKDAKVITHAVNGFLLEYYPYIPKGKEKETLVDNIYNFLIRALEKK